MMVLAYFLLGLAVFFCPAPSEACGGVFKNTSGNFSSPRYPKRYPYNLDCDYKFPACPDDRIALDCKSNLEKSTKCVNDYLKIDNMVYCGNIAPQGMVLEGPFVVEFHTNNQIRRRGFTCTFERLTGAYTGQCSQGMVKLSQPCFPVITTTADSSGGVFATQVKKDLSDWTVDLNFDKDVDNFEVDLADVRNVSSRSVTFTKQADTPGVAAGSTLTHSFTHSYDVAKGVPLITSAKLNGQELCK